MAEGVPLLWSWFCKVQMWRGQGRGHHEAQKLCSIIPSKCHEFAILPGMFHIHATFARWRAKRWLCAVCICAEFFTDPELSNKLDKLMDERQQLMRMNNIIKQLWPSVQLFVVWMHVGQVDRVTDYYACSHVRLVESNVFYNHSFSSRCQSSPLQIVCHVKDLKVICNGFSQNWWKSSF